MIGVWQIGGGVISAVTFLDGVSAQRGSAALALLLAFVGVALGSVLAGYGLYTGRAGAQIPSLIIQGLQLIGFNLGTSVFQLTLGPYVYLTLLWGARFSLDAGFMPTGILRWAIAPPEPTGVAINLLACWCFWRLLWIEPHQMRNPEPPAEVAATSSDPAGSIDPSAPAN